MSILGLEWWCGGTAYLTDGRRCVALGDGWGEQARHLYKSLEEDGAEWRPMTEEEVRRWQEWQLVTMPARMPPRRRERPAREPMFPFAEMEVGEERRVRQAASKTRTAACRFGRRHGRRFSCRRDGEDMIVRRIA